MRLPPALAAALGLLVLAAAPAPHAQEAAAPYVIRSWVDDVKLDDDATARWLFTVTYDPATGEYARTVRDASGALVEREVSAFSMASPSEGEIARARAIILADPELRALHDGARNAVLEGGFELTREAGHPCGPGSRCLQFDLYDVDHAARRVTRLRYVVVDLRSGALVSRDFDPAANGNETRFNRDRRTDAR